MKPMILIIDSEKLSREEWNELFKKCVNYCAWMHPEDREEITDFIDGVQDRRAQLEYKKKLLED